MLRRVIRWIGLTLVVLTLLTAIVGAATPLGRYIARAAVAEAKILLGRRSIDAMLSDSTVPAELRARLRLVKEARAFAMNHLGLEAGESFTTFSQLERDTLVLVLSAAYRDRLEAYRWWFPIVGRLPYKGYFDFATAQRERARFDSSGFDTYLRPASAFSTLGWFNDPLLSTTVNGDTTWLVNTVIHELSHNTLFVAGNAEFSESFASFIGARGAQEFFTLRFSFDAAKEVEADWANSQVLGAFWSQVATTLDSAYAAWPGDSAARVVARDSVYARARRVLVDSVGPRLQGVSPAWLERIPLDNAALLARRVYAGHLDLFDSVYVRQDRDLRRTMQAIREAVGGSADPFAALRSLATRPGR